MKNITLTFFFIFLYSCSFAQEGFNKKLSTHELKTDFELFKNTLKSIHPNLDLYTSKSSLDSMFMDIENQLQDSLSPVEFYRILTPVVHAFRNAHTIIKPPQSFLDYVNSTAKRLPMSFHYRNDSLMVKANYSSNKKLHVGDVITHINGISTQILIDSLEQFTFVDGYNKDYSDYISSKFLSKRYAYFLGLPAQFKLDFIDSEGITQQEIIEANSVDDFYPKTESKSTENKYTFTIVDDIAYLKINDFIIGNVRKFGKDLDKYFKQTERENIDQLVVDLRDNQGGNPEATNKLLAYFIKEKIYPVKEKFSLVNNLPNDPNLLKNDPYKYFNKSKKRAQNGLYYFDSESKVTVKPNRRNYQGKVIFLINENCASATTSFLGQIRTHRPDALFVGTKTLGNPVIVVADFVVSLKLPNSEIIVKIPLVSSEKNVNFDNPKGGVEPDVFVRNSTEINQLEPDKIMMKANELIREMNEN